MSQPSAGGCTVVIGAGGFIGRRITATLAGGNVYPVSSAQAAFDEHGLLRVDTLDAPDGVDAVIYLSQSPRYRDLPQSADHLWSVNVVSAIRAAEWARRRGAGRFIYASSGTVYAPGFDPHGEDEPLRRDQWYALSKVHAEEALAPFTTGLSVTCVRLFGVYGPHQQGKLVANLIASIRRGDSVHLQPHPTNPDDHDGMRLSLIHVDDAAKAIVDLIAHREVGVVNLASPEVLSIRQIASTIGERLGRQPAFETAAVAREGDVIANVSRLLALMPRPFATLASSIEAVIDASEIAH